jgi:hypothetical protein
MLSIALHLVGFSGFIALMVVMWRVSARPSATGELIRAAYNGS